MPKQVCVECETSLKVEQNGVIVVEMFNENCSIYRLWSADMWKCPLCGVEIVTGFGAIPITEHFMENVEEKLEEFRKSGHKVVYDREVR